MGYNVNLVINTGIKDAAVTEGMEIPYGYVQFFRALLPEGLDGLHGMPASEAAPVLHGVIARMVERDEEMEESAQRLATVGGWGSYEKALSFFRKLLRQCEAHPLAKVDVS